MKSELKILLKQMILKNASDLHITVGTPPQYRIDEKLVSANADVVNSQISKDLAYSLLSQEQIERFEKDRELDMSFSVEGLSRFRVNVYQQRGSVGVAIRAIPFKIMSFEECGLPIGPVTELSRKPKGLVLVTGATGSGKTTTLASMVNAISLERQCHIITIEDPIEFLHEHKKAIIEQRELGSDTFSFGASLKHVLRQDPDVILIGEMRDLETIESALIIAETGHLVFATLHTSDAVQTINRAIDVFPAYQQAQIRTQLSFVLMGVVSQQLIPRAKGTGRALATEILMVNAAVRSMIRESKVHQIYSAVQTGHKEGMRTMNQSLAELYRKGVITYEDAMGRTTDPNDLARLLHQ
ncbi:MAG: type IV pilus twitching motility protein PilT [Candidatus Omnitrophica bacterium]|nr:type IV pilus twitching motility protein PilT [Candidatus Omnitrophota bacterium]